MVIVDYFALNHIVLHQFVDDSLVFFRAFRQDSLQLRKCLTVYERASGKMINIAKYALTFSPSTSVQTIEEIKNVMYVEVVKGHDLYLGLLSFVASGFSSRTSGSVYVKKNTKLEL